MKGRENPSLYCYRDITYQSRGGTRTCEKACPYMEEKCTWPWNPLQVALWRERNDCPAHDNRVKKLENAVIALVGSAALDEFNELNAHPDLETWAEYWLTKHIGE